MPGGQWNHIHQWCGGQGQSGCSSCDDVVWKEGEREGEDVVGQKLPKDMGRRSGSRHERSGHRKLCKASAHFVLGLGEEVAAGRSAVGVARGDVSTSPRAASTWRWERGIVKHQHVTSPTACLLIDHTYSLTT